MANFLFVSVYEVEAKRLLDEAYKHFEEKGIKVNINYKTGTIKTDNLCLMSTTISSTIFGLIPCPDYVCISSRTRPLSDNELLKLEEIKIRYKEETKEICESEMFNLIEKNVKTETPVFQFQINKDGTAKAFINGEEKHNITKISINGTPDFDIEISRYEQDENEKVVREEPFLVRTSKEYHFG